MNTEVEKFADYLIEWITTKCDIELDRLTEFNIVRVIVDCVEMYENVKLREQKEMVRVIRNILWIALWIVGIVYGNLSNDGFYIFTALCLIGSTIS